MIHSITDILHYAKELKEAGVPDDQAAIHAEKLAAILENNVASKQDIERVEKDIQRVEVTLTKDIKHIDSKLNWLMVLIVFMGGFPAIVNGCITLSKYIH